MDALHQLQQVPDHLSDVLGIIDLDPATCVVANRTVQAATCCTLNDDGLFRDWNSEKGCCNPPVGRDTDKWVEKAIEEYRAGQAVNRLAGRALTLVHWVGTTVHAVGWWSNHGPGAAGAPSVTPAVQQVPSRKSAITWSIVTNPP